MVDGAESPSRPCDKHNLRLMCSYGGRIIPLPRRNTLCYIGGDTRIILIHRHISLSDLRLRLSKTLLQNHHAHQSFSLKYQLPNHDLDSLISLAADQDLHIMLEEYDRLHTHTANAKPARLRLFLFPNNIQQHHLLVDASPSTKSDDCFFNTLNGIEPGFSDSSSVNHLLGLDEDFMAKDAEEARVNKGCGIRNNNTVSVINQSQDVHEHSVPDSPMLETTSSFGSDSSSISAPILPPMKVHVADSPNVGTEDHFQQLSLSVGVRPPQKQEEGGFGRVVSGSDYPNPNRLISDDERSDRGCYNKAHQIQHQKQTGTGAGAFDLHSLDSVSSEASATITNPWWSWQRQAMYQEPTTEMQSANAKVTTNQVDEKTGDQNSTKLQSQMQMQPSVEDSRYVLSSQYEYDPSHPQLQQYVQLGKQFIPAGAMPVASYYPIYPPQQQRPHHPVYLMPARPQGYSIPPGSTNVHCSHPQAAQQAQAALATYNRGINVPTWKPEMAYRTAAPKLVEIPYGQHQHQPQYVGYNCTQIRLPSQTMTPVSPVNSPHEFSDPSHTQMCYVQPQYQTQTHTLTASLSDSAHLHSEK